MAYVVTLLTCIQVMPGLNLGWDTDYLDDVQGGFTLQENVEI
jgi:hypothetical protein